MQNEQIPGKGHETPSYYPSPRAASGERNIGELTRDALAQAGIFSPDLMDSSDSVNSAMEVTAANSVTSAAEQKEMLGPLNNDLVFIGKGLHDARQKKINPAYKEPADSKPANIVNMADYIAPDHNDSRIMPKAS